MIRLSHPLSVFGRTIDAVEVRTLSMAEAESFPADDFDLHDLAASISLPVNIAAELDMADVAAIEVERFRLEAADREAGLEYAQFVRQDL